MSLEACSSWEKAAPLALVLKSMGCGSYMMLVLSALPWPCSWRTKALEVTTEPYRAFSSGLRDEGLRESRPGLADRIR